MKKIIYIITGLNVGGAEFVLLRLLMKINKKKYDPLVITLREKGIMGERIERLGINIYNLQIDSIVNLIPGLIRLFRIMRKFKPQIVHTFLIQSALIGGIVAKLFKKVTIIWNIFSNDLSLQSNKFRNVLIFKLCSHLSKIIPNKIIIDSKAAYLEQKGLGYKCEKMEIIHNGVDINIFSPNKLKRNEYRQQYFEENEIVIGLIARFHPVKGHDTFIKAISLLKRKINNVKFLLNGSVLEINRGGGGIIYYKKLMKMIDEEGIKNVIHISDSKLKITDILFACDILVSPSNFESFPNIICEAMASGIPCVVTNVGDCSRIVGDTGVIVSANDPNALANALMRLIKMPSKDRKKLGNSARLRIGNNFSLSMMVEKYNNIYDSCI